jgi:hypothetical protein
MLRAIEPKGRPPEPIPEGLVRADLTPLATRSANVRYGREADGSSQREADICLWYRHDGPRVTGPLCYLAPICVKTNKPLIGFLAQ